MSKTPKVEELIKILNSQPYDFQLSTDALNTTSSIIKVLLQLLEHFQIEAGIPELVANTKDGQDDWQKLSQFLNVLEMKPVNEKSFLLNILNQFLQTPQTYVQKLYLSQFNIPEIPSAFKHQDALVGLEKQILESKEIFMEVYLSWKEMKDRQEKMGGLWKKVRLLEGESQSLAVKVRDMHQRVSNIPNISVHLQKAKQLNALLAQESQLSTQIPELNHLILTLDQQHAQLVTQLNQINQQQNKTPIEIYEWEKEQYQLSQYMNQQIELKYEAVQSQISILQEVLSSGKSLSTKEGLQAEIDDLTRRIQQLQMSKLNTNSTGNTKNEILQLRQASSTLEKKKQHLGNLLSNTYSTISQLQQKLNHTSTTNGGSIESAILEMKQRSEEYQQKKNILQDLNQESTVLQQNIEKLSQQVETFKSIPKNITNGEQLEKAIAAKKKELKPKIEQYRQFKDSFQKQISDFEEKKEKYNKQKSVIDSEQQQLQSSFTQTLNDYQQLESNYILLEDLHHLAKTHQTMVEEEMKKYTEGKKETKRDRLQKSIVESEGKYNRLRRVLEEERGGFESAIERVKLLEQLNRVLTMKLQSVTSSTTSKTTSGTQMTDRLVL